MDIAHDTARPAGPARRFKIAQMIDRLERPLIFGSFVSSATNVGTRRAAGGA
jgi:hypothetical protein